MPACYKEERAGLKLTTEHKQQSLYGKSKSTTVKNALKKKLEDSYYSISRL